MSNIVSFHNKYNAKHGKRPPKKERKTHRLWVRMPQDEFEQLQALAKLSNLSLPEYMRAVARFAIEETWRMQPTEDISNI